MYGSNSLHPSPTHNVRRTLPCTGIIHSTLLTTLLALVLAYMFCFALIATPVNNLDGFDVHSVWSRRLLHLGRWLPYDLHLAKSQYVSKQDTGYIEFLGLMVVAFTLYALFAFLMQCWSGKQISYRVGYALLWLGVLGAGIASLATPGILATDVYSYASYGRLWLVHSANPYFVPPSAYPHDPTYAMLYWTHTVSVYGPLWTLISGSLSLGTTHASYILAFRAFAFAAHLLNILLVTATLRAMGRSPRVVLLGTLLYAWNPLVLFESALGGHNDVFMVTFLLLGLFLSARAERTDISPPIISVVRRFIARVGDPVGKHASDSVGKHASDKSPHYRYDWRTNVTRFWAYVPPLIAFTLAALVKFSALPVIPIFLFLLFRRTLLPNNVASTITQGSRRWYWRKAILTVLIATLISAGVGLLAYAPFWLGHSPKAIMGSFTSQPSVQNAFNSLLFTFSALHSAHQVPASLSLLYNRQMWNALNIGLMLCVILLGLIALWRAPTTRMVAVATLATLSMFLIVTPWFFVWYVTWLIGLASVCLPINRQRIVCGLIAFALLFSLTALTTYYSTIIGWLLLTYQPPVTTWVVLVALVSVGVPVLAFLCVALKTKSGMS